MFAPSVDSHWLLSVNASRSRTGKGPFPLSNGKGLCLFMDIPECGGNARRRFVALGAWEASLCHPEGRAFVSVSGTSPVHGEVTAPGVLIWYKAASALANSSA